MRYPQERKEAVLKKMLPPQNKSIKELAEEEGISDATLYNWRKAARAEGFIGTASLSFTPIATRTTGLILLLSLPFPLQAISSLKPAGAAAASRIQ